jgi:hypothetical protein
MKNTWIGGKSRVPNNGQEFISTWPLPASCNTPTYAQKNHWIVLQKRGIELAPRRFKLNVHASLQIVIQLWIQ